MLRSMIIGLAIAAFLQCGPSTFMTSRDIALAARQIDWVQVQTRALSRLVSDGYTLMTR